MASDDELWRVWREAASRPGVAERLRGLLEAVDRRVGESGFACQQSGRCCRFESFGHRLYVTGLEVSWFCLLVGPPPAKESAGPASLPVIEPKRQGCPYQMDGACGVHGDRPFACRVFFCQAGSDAWQVERYEAFQGEIKRLHEQLGLPYRYMEWCEGLAGAGEEL